jgi:hypothetical protein
MIRRNASSANFERRHGHMLTQRSLSVFNPVGTIFGNESCTTTGEELFIRRDHLVAKGQCSTNCDPCAWATRFASITVFSRNLGGRAAQWLRLYHPPRLAIQSRRSALLLWYNDDRMFLDLCVYFRHESPRTPRSSKSRHYVMIASAIV